MERIYKSGTISIHVEQYDPKTLGLAILEMRNIESIE